MSTAVPRLFGVYVAKFPFLESRENKIRPVVVVSSPRSRHNIVAIVPISSKLSEEDIDVILADWDEEGLLKPSVARVHRLTTMLQSDLITELGILSDKDMGYLKSAIRELLNL